MSPASLAAIVIAILASPFAGCLAATFVSASLAGEPLLKSRPRCSDCGHELKRRDLIPAFSSGLSLGACRNCHTSIPLLYPATEAAFLAAALWAGQIEPHELILPGMLLGWVLIVLFVYDTAAFVLPNVLTYSLLVSGLGLAASNGQAAAAESAAGAFAGGACLLLVKILYRLARQRDGLGMGDVKLFAAAGAWVGTQGLPQILLIASLLGLIFAARCLCAARENFMLEKIPFGAGLCVALWITWTCGPLLPPGLERTPSLAASLVN
jgi:leader peptidase (prepilin peptidase)/N-methyltransferase